MFSHFKSLIRNDTLFELTVLILVAISAFGLGRLSMSMSGPASDQSAVTLLSGATVPADSVLTTEDPGGVPSLAEGAPLTTTSPTPSTGLLVASKSGTKYHLPTCGGAKQIKEENKLYFTSRAEAEAAGYAPAANCPGLAELP